MSLYVAFACRPVSSLERPVRAPQPIATLAPSSDVSVRHAWGTYATAPSGMARSAWTPAAIAFVAWAFSACTVDVPADDNDVVEKDLPFPNLQGTVVLNEIACHGTDSIELGNRSMDSVDVGGLIISDGNRERDYVLPIDASIPARGRLLVSRQTASTDGLLFGIACGEDTVHVVSSTGAVLDTQRPPTLYAQQTFSRIPDLDGDFGIGAPTPNAPNAPFVDESDILFEDDDVIDVELTLDSAAFASLNSNAYAYVEGDLAVHGAGIPDLGNLAVGVRLKGVYGSFRSLPSKAAFRIDMDRQVEGQRLFGLEHIVLNNMVQDPSYVHETLAYELFAAMGIVAPRTRHVRVTVNGESYGLYLMLEAWDEASLSRHFASTQHLFEGEYGIDVDGPIEVDVGDSEEFEDLDALRAALNTDASERWAALRDAADMDAMVRMWATELFLSHWDGYPTVNNYFLHSDADGVFTMLPWGTDQTFGWPMGFTDGYGRLFQTCMQLTECAAQYVGAVLDVADTAAALDLPARVDTLAARLAQDISADPKREVSVADAEFAQDSTRSFASFRPDEARGFAMTASADADGDGVLSVNDCNDSDLRTYPGADDVCGDGIDQDCDLSPDNGPTCPPCFPNPNAGPGVLFCLVPRSFADAVTTCEDQGAVLLVVRSLAQEQRIANAGLYSMWTGVTDQREEGVWRTVDGEAAEYLPWTAGEPNNSLESEHCAESYQPGVWNDANCNDFRFFACEAPCTEMPVDRDGDGVSGACNEDCNDADASIFPGAAEVCGDGIDQDCSAAPDDPPGCIVCAAELCVDTSGMPVCADIINDSTHCGQCNHACGHGSVCIAGGCTCPGEAPEQCTDSDGASFCTDLSWDAENCGACGNACVAGQICRGGSCICSPARPDRCGNDAVQTCVDTRFDRENCGACGVVCEPGETCAGGVCGGGPPARCADILALAPSSPNGVYTLDDDGDAGPHPPYEAYCDMTGDGGGWTLALKINGSADTFTYASPLWTNTTLHNPQFADLDATEAKLQSFLSLPFTELRVGMMDAGVVRWIVLDVSGVSLRSVFAAGDFIPSRAGRSAWKSLLADPSLQRNCNAEGLNTAPLGPVDPWPHVRIGIVSNGEPDCLSPDSWIGLGGLGAPCGPSTNVSAGNIAGCDSDSGDRSTATIAYVMVR